MASEAARVLVVDDDVEYAQNIARLRDEWNSEADSLTSPQHRDLLTQAEVIGIVNEASAPTDVVVTVAEGLITSNSWQYFRVDVPTNLPGWRVVLYSTKEWKKTRLVYFSPDAEEWERRYAPELQPA